MNDLVNEIRNKCELLDKAVNQFGKRGRAAAEAERNYRILFAKEILKLKSEGLPATLIPDIAKGNTADAKFERDTADVTYQSAKEAINALKIEIEVLDEQLSREWHSQ